VAQPSGWTNGGVSPWFDAVLEGAYGSNTFPRAVAPQPGIWLIPQGRQSTVAAANSGDTTLASPSNHRTFIGNGAGKAPGLTSPRLLGASDE
jgi:hypothetical protein